MRQDYLGFDTKHALTLLTRLAQRRGQEISLLERALSGRLDALAEIAVEVGAQTGDPIGLVLARCVRAQPDADLARRLERVLPGPDRTVALRELGAVVTAQILDEARQEAQPGDDAHAEVGRFAGNLANQLSALGKREAALAASEEAVAHYRELARTRPDAFVPDLATSLNNLANHLSDLGQREVALAVSEEAVAHYRELARTRPDGFVPNLAMSLNNLAAHLSDLGQREAALAASEEAVAHYRELARRRPDAVVPDLAKSLNNLADQLSDLGQREAALAASEEAVADYREL